MNKSRRVVKLIVIFIIFSSFGRLPFIHAQTSGAALNRPNSVFVSGDYAYVTSGNSNALEIIDTSNPSVPTHKSSISHGTDGAVLHTPNSVFVSGDYAYITSFLGNALEIVNISDPSNPTHQGVLVHGEGGAQITQLTSVFVSGNYAYVVSRGSKNLEIVDISNPSIPLHVNSHSFGSLNIPSSIFISDDYAYITLSIVGSGGGSLQIIDISNPSSVEVVGVLSDGVDGAAISNPTSIFISGNHAYITSLEKRALEIVDISDPTNPVHKGKISDGEGGAALLIPNKVYVKGNFAYVTATSGETLEIIDVSNPASPSHRGTITNGEGEATLSYPASVFVSGDHAYIPSYVANAFEVVDISNPENPVHKSKLLNGEIYGIPATPTGCTVDCFSNVLFLPGMMGSRLYEKDGSDDNQLWISTNDSDHVSLSLNAEGKSINNVYTKDDTQKLDGDEDETGIIDDVNIIGNLIDPNIYESFIDEMKSWKDDGTIADYAFIPYDWRLSLEDIITNGTAYEGNLSYNVTQDFSDSFILKKLEELQLSSNTGKVTLIAHSNGGLVIKALIQKLKDTNNPLYEKIDKVIFVAVPQVGTPEALVNLLHGTELGYGFIMGKDRSRQLAENMPVIYNLLPSSGYFSTVDPAFAIDKLVSFEDEALLEAQISKYGFYVSDHTELKNYVLGSDGRIKPSFTDTIRPNIGNSYLYDQAEAVHQVLDYWQPHPDTKVIQVAGWGEETIAGLDYKTKVSLTGSKKFSYKPRTVVDGDGTVVAPSALWMSDSNPNVERWWVDLKEEGGVIINRKHKDILEISNLLNFIKSKINDSSYSDPENILVNNVSTLVSNDTRLHYTLHSPLTLGITDSQGRYTGQDPVTREIRQEIPDVNYKQIGEVQFISVPEGLTYTVKMQGYEEGEFSLDVDKQTGNSITESTSFQGIPALTSTMATLNITPASEIGNVALKLDQNGDGVVDKTLQSTSNGTTVYDTTPPELQVTFNLDTKDVVFSAKDLLDPNPTIITTNASITLIDNAGNTTIIPFTKLKEIPTRLKLAYNKIIRNGITTNMPNTNIVYEWKEKKGALTDLDTKVKIKGIEKYVFNYKKANNVTIIKEKVGATLVTNTKLGFTVVTIKTEGDSLKIDY